MNQKMPYIDLWTRSFVDLMAERKGYFLARSLTELGSDTFLVPFTFVMMFVLWILYRNWLPALIFSGGTLLSYFLNLLIKGMFARERPSINIAANAEGYSFPSGHAMISLVCYSLLFYFLMKKLSTKRWIPFLRCVKIALVFSIGMSRYVINVHYLTDVVTGFIIGYFLYKGIVYTYEWVVTQNRALL